MRLALIEVAFYATMVGLGEIYFIADAVRLGAAPLELGLVATLPLCVGALGPLLGLVALAKRVRRKLVVLLGAGAQAAALAALAGSDYLATTTPLTLMIAACVYQIGGQAAGTAWASWFGDLVPADIRGRYFARRNRVAHTVTCAALIAAGALLHVLEPGAAGDVRAGVGGVGFAVIFAVASISRLLSAILLAGAYEAPYQRLPRARTLATLAVSKAGLPLRRLLASAFALQLMVYLSSPFFSPFMLEQLRLSYLEYTAGSVAVTLLKVITLPRWGRILDHHGARNVYLLAVALIGIVPLPWLWAEGLAWVLIAQALSGFAWGGHELAQFAYVLESTPEQMRPHTFASLTIAQGTAQLLGGLIGGVLLGLVGGDFRTIFAISMIGRAAVAALLPRTLPVLTSGSPVRRRQLFLRMVGIRPSGGASHGAIAVPLAAANAPAALTTRPSDTPAQETHDRTGASTHSKR